jgi:hypothetical protein
MERLCWFRRTKWWSEREQFAFISADYNLINPNGADCLLRGSLRLLYLQNDSNSTGPNR